MSKDQSQRPITFGDVFEAEGDLASQPINVQDAAILQKAEIAALGQVQRGGATALVRSAADRNLESGHVDHDAPAAVGVEGSAIVRTVVGDRVIDTEYESGRPVVVVAQKIPPGVLPADVPPVEPLTIGEALERAVAGAGTHPIEPSDARAIKSAESRVPGLAGKGGVGDAAQSAADLNPRIPGPTKTTITDVAANAASQLPASKYVTQEDAAKVREAEVRNAPKGEVREGGVADALKKTADLNEGTGVVSETY